MTNAQISVSTTPVTSCRTANGAATISVSTSASGFVFEYAVDGNYSDNYTFENLAAGGHTARVRDKITKCEFSKEFTIEKSNNLKVSISGSGFIPFCIGQSSQATLTATAFNGSGDYSYSWPGGSKTVTSSGWYSVTATDNVTGCTKSTGALVVFVPVVCAIDPNDIIGPEGYGPGKMVSKFVEWPYTIRFENDPEFATAPAQVVKITNPLDNNLNILSFRLGDFGFGGFTFTVPPNRTFYSTRLDVMDSLGVVVDVTAGIDIIKKEAFWIFESKDPATGLPPTNATLGFLPVNDTITHKGEGFVTYTIKPAAHTVTGDTVHAAASIIFDINAPIATPAIFNTIDAVNPVSRVKPMPAQSDTNNLAIKWTGNDEPGGSGVRSYDLFVSDNGAPYVPYQEGITDTSTVFTGLHGHTYDFYTIATDNTGNRESAKQNGEQRVTIRNNLPRPNLGADTILRKCQGTPVNLNTPFNLTGLYATWNTFTDTAQIAPGVFTLIANTPNGLKDTALVTVIDYPKPVLGSDTIVGLCSGVAVDLNDIYNTTGYASVHWNTPDPASVGAGIYTLTVTNNFGCRDTVVVTVMAGTKPNLGSDTTITICAGSVTSIRSLYDTTGYTTVLWTAPDPDNAPDGTYALVVGNAAGCRDTAMIIVVATGETAVPAIPGIVIQANRECTDASGWTHYFYDGGATDPMRLLSVKKNGNDIGTVGDGTFKLVFGTTAAAASNHATRVNSPLVPGGAAFYSMNRYWNLAPTHQPDSAVHVRFYFNTQDIADVNGDYPPDSLPPVQLTMYKLASGNPDPATNWANATVVNYYQNDTIPTLNKWVYTNLGNRQHQAEYKIAGFSGGGAGAMHYFILPVTGLTFNLLDAGDHIRVLWNTQTEINSKHFLVQRSMDGGTFETVAVVQARGNSNIVSNYNYDDFAVMPMAGGQTVYYRICQVDMDGRSRYSEIRSIKIPRAGNQLVLLYNPVDQQAVLRYNAQANSKAYIRIIDYLGRIVYMNHISLVKGANQIQLNTAALVRGIYEVELLHADDKQSVKMMKE